MPEESPSFITGYKGLTKEQVIEEDIKRMMDNYDPNDDTKLRDFLKEYLSLNNKCSEVIFLLEIKIKLKEQIEKEKDQDRKGVLEIIMQKFINSLITECGMDFGKETFREVNANFIEHFLILEEKLKPLSSSREARKEILELLLVENEEELSKKGNALVKELWESITKEVRLSTSTVRAFSGTLKQTGQKSPLKTTTKKSKESSKKTESSQVNTEDLTARLNGLIRANKHLMELKNLKAHFNEGRVRRELNNAVGNKLKPIINVGGKDEICDLTKFFDYGIKPSAVKKTINDIFQEYELGEMPNFEETVFQNYPNALELKIPKDLLEEDPKYIKLKELFISVKFNFSKKLLFILSSGDNARQLLFHHNQNSDPLNFDGSENTLTQLMFKKNNQNDPLNYQGVTTIEISDNVFDIDKDHIYLVFVQAKNPDHGYHLFIISKSINEALINIEQQLQIEADSEKQEMLNKRNRFLELNRNNAGVTEEFTRTLREINEVTKKLFEKNKEEEEEENKKLLKDEIDAEVKLINAAAHKTLQVIIQDRRIKQYEQETILKQLTRKIEEEGKKELKIQLNTLKDKYENNLRTMDTFQEELDIVINANRLVIREKELKVQIAEKTKRTQQEYTNKIETQHSQIKTEFDAEYDKQKSILSGLEGKITRLTSELESYKATSADTTKKLNGDITEMTGKIDELTGMFKTISEKSDTLSKDTVTTLEAIQKEIDDYTQQLSNLLNTAKQTTSNTITTSSDTVQQSPISNTLKGILKSSSTSTSSSTSAKSVSFAKESATKSAAAALTKGGARKGKSRKHLRKQSKKTKKRKASSKKTKRKKSKSTTKKRKKTKRKKRK